MQAPSLEAPLAAGASARALAGGLRTLLACSALLLPVYGLCAEDFSAAERAVFMDRHLASLHPPTTLHYGFHKRGTLEAGFDDTVSLALTAQSNGSCCAAQVQFFTGARAMQSPDLDAAQGNPAILYFLERDIHEMERLTHGKANYFRKRIRMAVYQGAEIRTVNLQYRGRPVAVQEISITPYLDDPNRSRYDQLAAKQYQFLLSAAVPGGLYGIRTRVNGTTADAPALLGEELLIDGAPSVHATTPLARNTSP
jgi:hypothetical protein